MAADRPGRYYGCQRMVPAMSENDKPTPEAEELPPGVRGNQANDANEAAIRRRRDQAERQRRAAQAAAETTTLNRPPSESDGGKEAVLRPSPVGGTTRRVVR